MKRELLFLHRVTLKREATTDVHKNDIQHNGFSDSALACEAVDPF
jgi:hypothetical protein